MIPSTNLTEQQLQRQSFGTTFITRASRAKGATDHIIFMRITVDKERLEFSTKFAVDPKNWHPGKGRVKGTGTKAKAINDSLDNLEAEARSTFNELMIREKVVLVEKVRDVLLGTSQRKYGLIDQCVAHLAMMRERHGRGYSPASTAVYQTTFNHLRTFVRLEYDRDEIFLKELDFSFVERFEHFLLTHVKVSINCIAKHMQRLRVVLNLCMKREILHRDPMALYKIKTERVEICYLTEDELERVMKKRLHSQRVARVRDTFLFACFTGFSYSDIRDLTACKIQKGPDGEPWLFATRQKTGIPCNVPLLPPALALAKRYANDEVCKKKGQVVPVLSNQKLNNYLKEIADLCDIQKNITMHVGRHTFATTVCLSQGVPIETVSKMLGHTNLKTTQIYAKVIEDKVARDMQAARNRFKGLAGEA